MKLLVVITLLYVSQHALGVEVEVYNDEESVLLPCQVTVTDPQFNAVSWIVERLSDQIVHQRIPSGDKLEDQNQDYVNRTSMRTDSMTTGGLSLTLKKPTVRDSETYTCIYREEGNEKRRQEVHLKVTVRPTPWWAFVLVVLVLLLLLLAGAAGGFIWFVITDEPRVQQVEVKEGKQCVLLPLRWTDRWWVRMRMCRICGNLPKGIRVEWEDGDDRKLHVYENGSDQPGEQHQDYRGQTEMNRGSLMLREPRLKDARTYYCRIYNLNKVLLRERRVELKVKVQLVQVVDGAESVLLPFQTTSGLPEDVRVEWRDKFYRKVHVYQDGPKEQELLYRGRTEMKKDLMKTGDYSLILKHITVRDKGCYICNIYSKDGDLLRERTVILTVIGQQVVVEVEEGKESVLLPFKTKPELPGDVIVEWTDRDNMKVHVYQNGSVEQDQVYRDRTEMNEDLMKTGDYSLTLKHIMERDSGVYYCRIYNMDGDLLRKTRVDLWVRVQQVEVESGAESVLLPFQTTADLPGDIRVEWTDRFNMKVHVYQNGSVEQDQDYRDRTEMNEDLMETGDYSLKLKHPTLRDSGGYTCRVYNTDRVLLRERRVILSVPGKQMEVVDGAESVLLPFKTTADLPGDVRVEWMDKDNRKVHVYQDGSVEQDQVYRGRTEMKKDLMMTGDYSLMLKHLRETDKGEYTCRVYNKDGDFLREIRVTLIVTGKKKPSTPGTEATPLTAEHMV